MAWENVLDVLWFLIRCVFWIGAGLAVLTVISYIWPAKKEDEDESKDIND